MSKRQCPFEYDLTPQMKMHVGQKEMDEKNEQNMSRVHEKTLQMLFNGAKQCYCESTNYYENKATDIYEYCALCVDLNVAQSKCSYCDKWTCVPCSAECVKCKEIFCVAHSVRLYRSELYERMCLNCCMED